jgi:hypothetical protein
MELTLLGKNDLKSWHVFYGNIFWKYKWEIEVLKGCHTLLNFKIFKFHENYTCILSSRDMGNKRTIKV